MSFRRLVIILILIAILTGIYVSCSTSKNSDMNDNEVSKTTEESTSTKTGEDTKASEDTKAADRTSIKNTQQSETQQQQHDTQQPEQQLPSQLPKPSFVDRKSTEVLNIERNTIQYEPKVKPYIINSDLSNIVNIEQYGDFTHEQKELIAKNGFVVVSSNEEQLFYIYENNEYLKLPSFVTTDSVLQVFHLFFDYSLRILETEKLMLPLKQMTDSMLKKSIVLYNQIKAPQLKTAALKNIAYFAVAQKALGEEYPSVIPDEAKKLAELEFALVEGAAGIAKSNIFPFDLDYSQYKPRGHYTRNEEFEKYFRAMMWYGQAPFPVFKATPDGKVELNVEQTAQALLITYCMFCNIDGSSDIELWEKIYEPTVFYVGNTDDLNLYQYKDLLISIYGEEPDIEKLLEPHYIERLYSGAKLLPEPQIQAKWISVDIPSGLQFRFMGQRYIPDSDIMQNLVEPIIRPVPRGLDVMGVLGSERASDLLINKYKEGEKWEEYKSRFAEQKSRFSKLPEETWHSNMYYGWLWTLRGLLKSFGDGYPSFMTNEAWEDKSLSTALASWAEMRHDTILYAKPTGAECGGGEEPPVIKSYVEPNIEVYNRLLGLTSYARENLSLKDILPDELKYKMQHFEDLLQFLINCSIKELNNEELSKEEYYQLLIYGGTLERLSTSLAEGYKGWYEITSETDRNMALIADVHSTPGACLEVGVGPAAQIFVAVPIGGKIYLTRGAVFSYYEFMSEKRLTDEEWQEMFKTNNAPNQPDWTNTFTNGRKDEIPVPAKPYSSGC